MDLKVLPTKHDNEFRSNSNNIYKMDLKQNPTKHENGFGNKYQQNMKMDLKQNPTKHENEFGKKNPTKPGKGFGTSSNKTWKWIWNKFQQNPTNMKK